MEFFTRSSFSRVNHQPQFVGTTHLPVPQVNQRRPVGPKQQERRERAAPLHRRQDSLVALQELKRFLTEDLASIPADEKRPLQQVGMKAKSFALQKTKPTDVTPDSQIEIEEEVELKLRLQTVMEGKRDWQKHYNGLLANGKKREKVGLAY